MNKSDKPTKLAQIPSSSDDPKLDFTASYEFGKIIDKVKNRASVRCRTLEQDIIVLVEDFLKNCGFPGQFNFRLNNQNTSSYTDVETAVHSFCSGLTLQVQEKEVREFVESFSAKILDVSEAGKISG
jgi:hypothetical protein